MESGLKTDEKEIYEQFDTNETAEREGKRHKKNYLLSPKKLIRYISYTVLVLCLFILLSYNMKTENHAITYEAKEGDKPLTQNANCEPGYKVVDGKCVINHSIRADYYTEQDNEKIEIIHQLPISMEITIDGQKVEPNKEYIFPKKGNHTVFFLGDFSKLNATNRMFYQTNRMTFISFTPLFDSSNVVNMKGMFYECISLTSIDLSNLNTGKVANMELLFAGCHNLLSLDLSHFDTRNVKTIANIFEDCTSLTQINLSNFITDNVNDMSFMFFGCTALSSIDLSHFNTKQTTTM